MKMIVDIPEDIYDTILDDGNITREQLAVLQIHILKGTPFAECEEWKQLKETITEIKDNNQYDNDTATELSQFLLNYMKILESEENE